MYDNGETKSNPSVPMIATKILVKIGQKEAKLIILLYFYFGNKFSICHWDCSCLFKRILIFLINGEIEIGVQKRKSAKKVKLQQNCV